MLTLPMIALATAVLSALCSFAFTRLEVRDAERG